MKRPKVRLNLLVALETRKRLERLVNLTGADSMTEVIRRALMLFEILVSARKEGDSVVVRAKDGSERELILT